MLHLIGWDSVPGNLPMPRVEDDRESIPPALVKDVIAWLKREKPRVLARRKPTDQRIGLPGISSGEALGQFGGAPAAFVEDGKVLSEPIKAGGMSSVEFQPGTAEIVLKIKNIRIASFHYQIARDPRNGLTICGDLLWIDREDGERELVQ